jgi:F-type H+-transporting ATPase subunit b
MKRFLYKPILHAIDEREKRIAKELADADTKKAEAQKERDEFQHKNEEFDQQRAALLEQGDGRGKSRTSAAPRRSAEGGRRLACQTRGRIETRTAESQHEITRRTQQEVFAIARKTLTDLAGTSLEERMSEVFTRRLRELDDEAKKSLAKALKTLSDPCSCAAPLSCLRSSARRYNVRSTKPSRLKSTSVSRPRQT